MKYFNLKFLLLLFLAILSTELIRAQFSATLLYGIPVSVNTWNGEGSVYDFANQSVGSKEEQGKLVILGRDSKYLWFIQGGCPNDACDDCFFIELGSIDSTGKTIYYPADNFKKSKPDSKAKRVSDYKAAFTKYKLEKLIPVNAWQCAYTQSWIAQVNCKELNSCFQFNYNITPAGGCWNNFNWETTRLPLQTTRTVRFPYCTITIPSEWKYAVQENGEGYVTDGEDTMYHRLNPPIRVIFIEMKEYILSGDNDSVNIRINQRIRRYNDSLHRICPEMLTHTRVLESVGKGYIERWYPNKGVTSWIRYVYRNDVNYEFATSLLAPDEQAIWIKVLGTVENL